MEMAQCVVETARQRQGGRERRLDGGICTCRMTDSACAGIGRVCSRMLQACISKPWFGRVWRIDAEPMAAAGIETGWCRPVYEGGTVTNLTGREAG
jgi:hypothetical protein